MANLIKQLMQSTGKSADEVFDFIKKMSSGGRELDLGDIKSPSIKKGRPSKPIAINPNEIDVGKIKTDLELGDIPSSNMSLNELDLGPIDPLALKRGRPSKPMIGVNEKDLGSAKSNLDIGDAQSSPVALNELDMPEISQVPSVSNQVPAVSGGLSPAGGGRVPTVIGEAIDDVGGPLAKRASTVPTEVGPQVLGKGRKYTDEAGNIVDAEIVEKTLDGIKKMPEGPLKSQALKKYAKWAAIAAGAGGLAMYDGDNQPSTNAMSKLDAAITKSNGPVSSKSPNYNDLIQEEANNQPSTKSLESQQQNKPISKVNQLLEDAEGDPQAKDNRLNYMELMQNAQQSANQNQLGAALLKAGMQAGAAIAGPGAKVDYSLADSLAASADKPVSNVKGLMDTDISSKKLKQIQDEMNDEAKMRDPNSEISKFYRDQYGSFFPGISSSTTAFAMNKVAPGLIQLHNTREAAASRKEATAARKEQAIAAINATKDAKEDTKLAKAEEKDLARLDKRKLITEEVESFRRTIASNVERAKNIIKESGTFELTGDASEELDAIMDEISSDMAKLKDPDSAAREGEVRLVRKTLLPGSTIGKLGMRNNTALSLLNKFEGRVQERADEAYRVRGVELPKAAQTNKLTTKTVSPETQERLINHVMTQNKVDRATAVNALTKAGKL
jgi:hypothetical protein